MALPFAKLQRHHVALDALGCLVECQLPGVKGRQHPVLFVFGRDRRQH
ncbi:MAG: hypothetical protein JWP47_1893 [Polaromonas sp.]|nr:hypothetical protein [Polaromonas sp.]